MGSILADRWGFPSPSAGGDERVWKDGQMSRFTPFRGLRFDTATASLADLTAPPYDVIDDADRVVLAARHAHNAVHVDLPVDTDGVDRYTVAARLFEQWQDDGVLVRDESPAFYGYRMSFTDPTGRTRRTTGVLGSLLLSEPGEGHILPHEQTTPKAKSDRLEMLRACRANLSPIWGLSPTPGLTAAIGEPPPDAASWTDDDGITHTLWVITDPTVHQAITELVDARPVVVADGHHRYETSIQYRNERRAEAADGGGADDAEADAEAAMVYVVELVADELTVLPIHRLVTGVADGVDLAAHLDHHFEVGPEVEATPTLLDEMITGGFLVLVQPDSLRALRPRPGVFDQVRDLDTVRLDTALAGIDHVLDYQHGIDHVVRAVADGRAQAGVLVRPATVAQIAATADGGERMPPKTTFFHPKPKTGLVFRTLD
jgi:uncharacterized protein (DUF1015 family)